MCTHSPLPPSFLVNLHQIFKKREGAWQNLNFERGLVGKVDDLFEGGVAIFKRKMKLKSEIFHGKVYKQKCFSLS